MSELINPFEDSTFESTNNGLFIDDFERNLLVKALNQTKLDKTELIKPKQIREIVPIEKWLEDEFYSGADAIRIYPYWKDVLCKLFAEDSNYTECVLSGSIGTGKSTVSVYGMLRKLYEMSCYENISGLYNLMKTSMIAIMYFSVTRTQAELTGYGQMKAIYDSIPYFRQYFPRNERMESMMVMPERTLVLSGSDTSHAIGMNLIGSILDEANFHQGESTNANVGSQQQSSKVSDMYASLVARGRSRFMFGGKNHSLSFLVSSATHASSFTEKRIQLAQEDKSILVACPKIWEVKPDGTYSDKRFYVFTGNDSLDPKVIESESDMDEVKESLHMSIHNDSVEEGAKKVKELHPDAIVAVPTDFRQDFSNDLFKSLQDLAGVSTSPTGVLFSSRPTYNKCIDSVCEHPFTKEVFTISTKSKLRLEDYLKKDFRFVDPHKPHYIHVDQSKSGDCTGLGMVHLDSFIVDEFGYKQPVLFTDFKLRIAPPRKPAEISITKVRQFFTYLREYMHINIRTISYDQYASDEALQVLQEEGFNAKYQSVDRTDKAYLNACNLLYEQRIKDYNYEPFNEEWFFLMHDTSKRKVDHVNGRKKDVSDGWVGAIQNCINDLPDIGEISDDESEAEDYSLTMEEDLEEEEWDLEDLVGDSYGYDY